MIALFLLRTGWIIIYQRREGWKKQEAELGQREDKIKKRKRKKWLREKVDELERCVSFISFLLQLLFVRLGMRNHMPRIFVSVSTRQTSFLFLMTLQAVKKLYWVSSSKGSARTGEQVFLALRPVLIHCRGCCFWLQNCSADRLFSFTDVFVDETTQIITCFHVCALFFILLFGMKRNSQSGFSIIASPSGVGFICKGIKTETPFLFFNFLGWPTLFGGKKKGCSGKEIICLFGEIVKL